MPELIGSETVTSSTTGLHKVAQRDVAGSLTAVPKSRTVAPLPKALSITELTANQPTENAPAGDSQVVDHSSDFGCALQAYLTTLMTVGDCVAAASPEVGEPYRRRLTRLRARVAFQPTPETLTSAAAALDTELKEYAAVATRQTARYNAELRREIASFHEIIESIAKRQDFFTGRLRQFAVQMEASPYPTDPGDLSAVLELQAAGLRNCLDSMTAETASLVARMRQEMKALDERLAGVHGLDPMTGLINREEMLFQIASHRESGAIFTLLRLDLEAPAADSVMRQAADRLLGQFRHYDRVARWGKREFMVLFQGPRERAESRAQQVLPWITSRYKLDSGDTADVAIAVHTVDATTSVI